MDQQISRRHIGRLMKQEGLVSNYIVAQFKPHKVQCKEDKIENDVNREFNNQKHLNVVVSDLIYVRVGNRWYYLCILVDLFNREIISYSSGPNKISFFIKKAFRMVKINLNQIKLNYFILSGE